MGSIIDVRFLGSSLALVIGALGILGGLGAATEGQGISTLWAGTIIVLGALVYRSRKRRILGERESTRLRVCTEYAVLLVILAAWLLQKDLLYLIATDPAPQTVPVLVFLAYACAGLWHRIKRRRGRNAGAQVERHD